MTAEDRCLVYVLFGEDPAYYQGAVFSLLTLMRASGGSLDCPVHVLAQQPEWFDSYPVRVTPLESEMLDEWSLGGRYAFRIKSQGVRSALETSERLCFADADLAFSRPLDSLFDRIRPDSALMYSDEGPVLGRRRFSGYEPMRGRHFDLDGGISWGPSEDSRMWGSAIIGLHRDMAPALDLADRIQLALLDVVEAHTIEQFALAEALRINGIQISAARHGVIDYSTFGKKLHARTVLDRFFAEFGRRPLREQVEAARPGLMRRPLGALLRQKLVRR